MKKRFKSFTLTLGKVYMVWGRPRILVRVTRKGFNFLDPYTSSCVHRHHLYAKDLAGKPVPRNRKTFTFLLPHNWDIRELLPSERAKLAFKITQGTTVRQVNESFGDSPR